jgi:hypothetical protein
MKKLSHNMVAKLKLDVNNTDEEVTIEVALHYSLNL